MSVFDPISTTDHSTISIYIELGVLTKKTFNILVWDYKNIDYNMLRRKHEQAAWDNCFLNNDINDIVDSWVNEEIGKWGTNFTHFLEVKKVIGKLNENFWNIFGKNRGNQELGKWGTN